MPGAADRFVHIVAGADVVPRSMLFTASTLAAPGLVDALAAALEALQDRQPLYRVLAVWGAAVQKLLVPHRCRPFLSLCLICSERPSICEYSQATPPSVQSGPPSENTVKQHRPTLSSLSVHL